MAAEPTYQNSRASPAALPIQCRVCGGNTGRRFAANGFAWLRCKTCHTTQKVITQQQYRDLNPSYDPGEFLDSCDRQQIETYLDVRGATQVLSRVIDDYLDNTTAHGSKRYFLDVGSGMGRYLIAGQRLGFEVLGFEPSMDHARVATEHFKLPVVNDYFSADRVNGRKFDLIILSHVIEHIYDPKSFIRELVDVLRPGGALIVITPNNNSLLARTIGSAWPMLKPIDHVSMISADAYGYFDLSGVAEVHHSSSEYPFEFAAAALAAAKSFVSSARRGQSTNKEPASKSVAPPLRRLGVGSKLLRYGLSAISAPMHVAAIATNRQACLKSIVVRRT